MPHLLLHLELGLADHLSQLFDLALHGLRVRGQLDLDLLLDLLLFVLRCGAGLIAALGLLDPARDTAA